MANDKHPYRHGGRMTGFGSASESKETEHRDTARPAADERNELDPERRNREKRYGPRTHEDTRIDPDPRFADEDR